MNHKPNRFNDILTNIVTGVTITDGEQPSSSCSSNSPYGYSNNPLSN